MAWAWAQIVYCVDSGSGVGLGPSEASSLGSGSGSASGSGSGSGFGSGSGLTEGSILGLDPSKRLHPKQWNYDKARQALFALSTQLGPTQTSTSDSSEPKFSSILESSEWTAVLSIIQSALSSWDTFAVIVRRACCFLDQTYPPGLADAKVFLEEREARLCRQFAEFLGKPQVRSYTAIFAFAHHFMAFIKSPMFFKLHPKIPGAFLLPASRFSRISSRSRCCSFYTVSSLSRGLVCLCSSKMLSRFGSVVSPRCLFHWLFLCCRKRQKSYTADSVQHFHQLRVPKLEWSNSFGLPEHKHPVGVGCLSHCQRFLALARGS